MGRKLFWLLVIATLAVFGAMNFWAGPIIARESLGGVAFDMRILGYSYAEAQAFLTALSAEGRAFYLGPAMRLDLFFPAMLATVLAVANWHLLGARRLVWKFWVAGLAAGFAVFDYLENATVAGMLRVVPDEVTPEMVALASQFTVVKYGFVGICLVVLLALLVGLAINNQRTKSA